MTDFSVEFIYPASKNTEARCPGSPNKARSDARCLLLGEGWVPNPGGQSRDP
jgi:hypothetical protein